MFVRTQVLSYDKLHIIEIMLCKSYYKFAYTMNTHSKCSRMPRNAVEFEK